jgi:hypothetical protein
MVSLGSCSSVKTKINTLATACLAECVPERIEALDEGETQSG